jgi:hypothetical protein
MNKNELIDFLNNIFKPLGFKKKSSNWYYENDELIKKINLQRSQYGNYYYINYGYIIKYLDLDVLDMHIYYGVATSNKDENLRIEGLLNLDNNIPDEIRKVELTDVLNKLLIDISSINTEEDILNKLKERDNLNSIPLVVKRHFNLET